MVATTGPVLPTCINGKVFETCGTACPLTCDNYRSPPFACPAVCAQGCFCPHGLVELGDTCVPPTSCPGKLLQLKEWGSSYLPGHYGTFLTDSLVALNYNIIWI